VDEVDKARPPDRNGLVPARTGFLLTRGGAY